MSAFSFDGFNLHDGTTYRVTAAGSAPGKPAPLRHVTAAFPGSQRMAVVPRPPGPGSITLAIAVTGDLATGTLGTNLDVLLKVLHARPREPRWLAVTLGTSARRVLAVPTMVDVADLLPMLARVTVTFATDGYWESTAWSSSVQTGALSSLVALGMETGNAYGHRLSLTPGGNAPTTPRVLLCVQSGSQTPTRFTLRSLYTSPYEASSLSLSLAAGSALAWDPYLQSCVSLSLTSVRGWWPLAESGGTLRDFSSGSRDLTPSPATFTLSGNEITDAVRTTNTGGDGRTSPDSSAGIWPAATNLIANGGFESNTTGWDAVFNCSISRVDEQAKFGSWSLKATATASNNVQAGNQSGYAAVSAGTAYSASIWVRAGTALRVASINIRWFNSGGGFVADSGAGASVTLSSTWQRLTVTATAPGTAARGVLLLTVTGCAAGETLYLDGAQIEAQAVPSPYVHTDGGTATRSAARVQATGGLVSAAQGWVALRLRMGWGSAAPLSWATALSVADNAGRATGRVELYFDQSVNKWTLVRDTAWAGTPNVQSGAVSFARDATVTLVARWTASAIGLSVDGGAFTSGAAAQTISTLASTFDIGSVGGASNHLGGDVLWAACGTGTLTDADAATLAALGSTDPTTSVLPSTAALTAVWPADTSSFTATAYTYLQDGPLYGGVVPAWPALDFDGTLGEFTSSSADFSLTSHIVCGAWIQPDAIGSLMGVMGKATTNAGFWLGVTAAGLLTGGVGSGAATRSATGTTTLTAGRWYHAVLVWDSTAYTVTLYLDGELEAVTTGGALTVGGYSGNFLLGSAKDLTATTRYWNGKIAEPFVLNNTLTQTQVRNVYQRGLAEYNPTVRAPSGWPWPALHGEGASATNGYEIRVTHASTAPDIRAALAWHPAYTSA